MKTINIEKDLYKVLLSVEKPGRYTGGEYGIRENGDEALLSIALSYPDLYEIGMSNLALRLLYARCQTITGLRCERVFAPAPDFEEQLRLHDIPLYSLETGSELKSFHIIGFSIGYELTLTNMLAILELGRISIFADTRGNDEPIIIAGGPTIINPAPYSKFIDCIYMGDGEAFVDACFPNLVVMKKRGASKEDMLECMLGYDAVWSMKKKNKKVKKCVWMGFGNETSGTLLPVPSIRTVQDQGVVEIMRGCPHSCRFCVASIYYRPFRLKKPDVIVQEIEQLIMRCGYRRISLSSLSSGDYNSIDLLVKVLTQRYKHLGVSFALPSLRIDSIALNILSDIAEVRKSGLTFAVETPRESWQRGINKRVSMEKTIAILKKAKTHGWKKAKFYFMIGLPLYTTDESDAIVDFILEVKKETQMNLHINLSTFVPKPHTPFQWAPQLSEDEAMKRIRYIKHTLAGRSCKISYHSPFASLLEGLISRGDERVCDLVAEAFKKGARLDAWEDYMKRDIWRTVIKNADWDVEREIIRERALDEILPWNSISPGIITTSYLKKEWEKANRGQYTPPCQPHCKHSCGICGQEIKVDDTITRKDIKKLETLPLPRMVEGEERKLLFSFSKQGKAIFLSHLDCMHIFERALLRAGYHACFTTGFNPKPLLIFAAPLALGIESREEIASIELYNLDSIKSFIARMNMVLPDCFTIHEAKLLKKYIPGTKKESLPHLFWGSDYIVKSNEGISPIIHLYAQINGVIEENEESDEFYEFSPALDAFFMMNDGICIRWKNIGKKGINIQALLKKLIGRNAYETGITIFRHSTLAQNKEGQPDNYFNVVE
jgi:radical SAM-linked protein